MNKVINKPVVEDEVYTCRQCGEQHTWPFGSKYKGHCHTCQFWLDRIERERIDDGMSVFVNGTAYRIAPEDEKGGFRGFGGAEWFIRFNDGREVTTTNLWCQGDIPERFQGLLPNNAVFLPKKLVFKTGYEGF